jgi:hypothetical protein
MNSAWSVNGKINQGDQKTLGADRTGLQQRDPRGLFHQARGDPQTHAIQLLIADGIEADRSSILFVLAARLD